MGHTIERSNRMSPLPRAPRKAWMVLAAVMVIGGVCCARPLTNNESVRGWTILSDSVPDARTTIAAAPAYHINHLQLSHQIISDLREIKRDPIYIAQHAADPAFTFASAGSEKVGDVEAAVLDVSGEGASVRWYVDPSNGHILRARWQGSGPEGPAELVADFSDWRTVDGVTLSFKETETRNGETALSEEMQKFEVNPSIDMKIFEKPAPKSPGQ